MKGEINLDIRWEKNSRRKMRLEKNFLRVLHKNLMVMNFWETILIPYGKQNYIPIDIVYEPTLDTEKPIEWFFAPDVSLAFNCRLEKSRRGKKELMTKRARQCHYCNNYFVKSFEKMQKHISCCTGQAGFTFSFDNGNIIDYQDHYSNLGDIPFSIYYDFETATGSAVFFVRKCM